jgi:hypothetical protein
MGWNWGIYSTNSTCQEVSILSCWYYWILLYIIYALIERDLTKAAYIPVKTEEKLWFFKTAAYVIDNRFWKKCKVQALVCKMEGGKVHLSHKKHRTNFCVTRFDEPARYTHPHQDSTTRYAFCVMFVDAISSQNVGRKYFSNDTRRRNCPENNEAAVHVIFDQRTGSAFLFCPWEDILSEMT